MINFRTQNGANLADRNFQSLHLPHLILMRNGKLTPVNERNLTIVVSDVQIPSSGAAVSLEVSTQHTIQAQGEDIQKHILVWQETRWISSASNSSRKDQLIIFQKVFLENFSIKGQQFTTPTDYFRVEIRVTDQGHPHTNPLYKIILEYAFMMENQWLVDLPEVREDTPGAAPSELMLYYCDMFPFQSEPGDPHSRIPRESITQYLESDLIPAMQEAFRTESDEWGFPWYQEWLSYRKEDPPNRLSVALTDGTTWYHGQSPPRGLGRISLRLDSKDNASYRNLTESLMSTFYHELFHNLQRNINLHQGGDGDVDGYQDAWQFFSEGTAVLATSVGQPDVQFSHTPGLPAYFIQANGLLAGGGHVERELNKSYEEIDPYHAVIYWRFLYEKCGGMLHGSEYPSTGMQIILNALSLLYSEEIVDIQSSNDLVEHLPGIMDLAIQTTATCPFDDYKDSLIQFASAIYSLQLENGRCVDPGLPVGCGMYDPVHGYLHLPIPEFTYTGDRLTLDSTQQPFPGGIKSSFGINFIEINLTRITNGKSLILELESPGDVQTEFAMHIIMISNQHGEGKIYPMTNPILTSEDGSSSKTVKQLAINIPKIELGDFNQLGIIITRIDNQERIDHAGVFTIELSPY